MDNGSMPEMDRDAAGRLIWETGIEATSHEKEQSRLQKQIIPPRGWISLLLLLIDLERHPCGDGRANFSASLKVIGTNRFGR